MTLINQMAEALKIAHHNLQGQECFLSQPEWEKIENAIKSYDAAIINNDTPEEASKEYAVGFYNSNHALDGMPQSIIDDAHRLAALHFSKGYKYASLQSTKDKDRIAELEKEVEMLRGLVGKAMEWVSISTLFFDEETNSWDDLFIKGTPCTTPELVELFLKENKQP